MPRSIRAGMGLGDSLYLQAVARHFVQQGETLQVCSKWPEVFRPLQDSVKVVPFRRVNVDICAHYSMRKLKSETTQFEDCCIQAGIKKAIDFRLDWGQVYTPLTMDLLLQWKPVICVQLPRVPMDRVDGFGASLLPAMEPLQTLINLLKDYAYIVQIGSGRALHKFDNIDLDLSNKTTVTELIDVASVASGFLGYCSFMVPLAESLNRPALFVWSTKGLADKLPFIRSITPKKILHRDISRFVLDTDPIDKLEQAVHDLLHSF